MQKAFVKGKNREEWKKCPVCRIRLLVRTSKESARGMRKGKVLQPLLRGKNLRWIAVIFFLRGFERGKTERLLIKTSERHRGSHTYIPRYLPYRKRAFYALPKSSSSCCLTLSRADDRLVLALGKLTERLIFSQCVA